MLLQASLCLFSLLILIGHVSCVEKNYYWRQYTGNIPSDAFVAGKDINNKAIYIGQGYLRNHGLIPTQINPGVREVLVPWNGAKKVDQDVKILCGPQTNFYWLTTSSTDLHLVLLDKHAVIGGYQDGFGVTHIGRISHGGESKIGKINSFQLNNAGFYFADKNREKRVVSYQVLCYEEITIDPRISQ